MNALLTAEDGALELALDTLAEHAHRHFGEEDASMRERPYGSVGCHIDEHVAVLKSIDDVREMLARGRPEVARSFFAHALMDWFPEHVHVMDQGLARWLIQHKAGWLSVGHSTFARTSRRLKYFAAVPS